MTGAGPGPEGDADADLVQTELERVVRRWQQLPLDRALLAVAGVRELVQSLADEAAVKGGQPQIDVPDLGPAVLMDQLRVIVYDWRAAGLGQGASGEASLGARLTGLRRTLP